MLHGSTVVGAFGPVEVSRGVTSATIHIAVAHDLFLWQLDLWVLQGLSHLIIGSPVWEKSTDFVLVSALAEIYGAELEAWQATLVAKLTVEALARQLVDEL